MSVVGDVFQIKVSYQIPNVGDEALNVFFYTLTSGAPAIEDIADGFAAFMWIQQRDLMADSVYLNYVEAVNLFNLSEYALKPYDVGEISGNLAGEVAPPGVAINFLLRRTSRLVRNGSKRIGGVPNSAFLEGKIVDVGYLGELALMNAKLAAIWTEPVSDAELTPCIVKRIKTANPDYPDSSKYPFKYTLPTTQGEAILSVVRSAQFSLYASSQASRKTNH